MRLNFWETLLVNNPVRAFVQRQVEAPLLLRLGGRLDGKRVLEVGCGRGVGAEIVLEKFGADSICAIDLDPNMIERARRRLSKFPSGRFQLKVGDAASIDFPDASFDAVFDFGIIHHVPNWQASIREIRRVLKADGIFFFEEVPKKALEKWLYRTFLEHPKENRFESFDFVEELKRNGFVVSGIENLLGSDVFAGVARATRTIPRGSKE